MSLYYNSLQESEQDRRDAARYAEKRRMTEEEKKKVIFRMSKESFETAKKLIAASGKKPLEYSPVTRECMAAMIYGTLFATSLRNLATVIGCGPNQQQQSCSISYLKLILIAVLNWQSICMKMITMWTILI